MEQILLSLKTQHEKILGDYPSTFATFSLDKQIGYLNTENKQIRDELKRLNDFISFIVDYKRHCKSHVKP